MIERAILGAAMTLFGFILGMWFYSHMLRAIAETHEIHVQNGHLAFIPRSPTPPEETLQ